MRLKAAEPGDSDSESRQAAGTSKMTPNTT